MSIVNSEVNSWENWIRLSDEMLLKHCRIEVVKGTGRGGQKRNKTSNHVRLTFQNIQVEEGKARSLDVNKKKCLFKLRLKVATTFDNQAILRTERISFSEEFKNNIRSGKISINDKNRLFPVFSGQLLDILYNQKLNWSEIKDTTGVSRTQITRWLEQFSWGAELLKFLYSIV